MPKCRAEKPSLTSSLVRPLTSFEAAQSSRTMRVFVPLKAKLANFSHASTDYYIQPRVSLTKPEQRSVIFEGWAYQHNVIKLAIEWAPELVHQKLGLARVGHANDQSVEWYIVRVHFNTAQIVTACS